MAGLRVAAVGDVHASGSGATTSRARSAPRRRRGHGVARRRPDDARARGGGVGARRRLPQVRQPVLAVLGNHDHHSGRPDEVAAVLDDVGVTVLDGGHVVLEAGDMQVGVVGTKGSSEGFPGAEIADFGERLLREVYAETTRQVDALEAGLEAIAGCERRLVLLHYAPISDTLVGEPEGIWAFLGSGRLAGPIGAHRPDVVFHGHAHHGRRSGAIGSVPVYNVARHVIERDFAVVRV